MKHRIDQLLTSAQREQDALGLAAFRVLFGVLVAVSAIRFELNGWVERCFVSPRFFFHYWGFEWVRPGSPAVMHGLFVLMAVCGVCIALGLAYRLAAATFFLVFTYVELIDVTNYLNHYYLVSLLALLVTALPLHAHASIDAWLRPSIRRSALPAWMTWLLRFQVGAVYFFAAIAKAQPDWLLHGQPLSIWLAARTDTPWLGALVGLPFAAIVMSWGGFLYDLTIPLWLSIKRTRGLAYLAVLGFHGAVGVLFPIGMFPFIMIVATTVFFEPSWPRRLLSVLRVKAALPAAGTAGRSTPRFALALVALYVAVQVVMPLRALAYGGDVLWHEQGMRWSWRVLVREKNGAVTFRVRARDWSHERLVTPDGYLNEVQEREMSQQPDLILQLAHHIADDLRRRGLEDVEVRVDARASLNGRPMAPLIDPDVDLAQVEDSLLPASWITEAPGGDPPTLTPRASFAQRAAR
jgi:vitamin K-dependent gamma-carboxylase